MRLEPVPSAFVTWISQLSVRLLTKAIRRPSGNQAGWISPARVRVRRA
jgi:hypothetical protein